MTSPVVELCEVDAFASDSGVEKVIGVENCLTISRGKDGTIGLLISRGPEFAAINLTQAEAEHVRDVLTRVISEDKPAAAAPERAA